MASGGQPTASSSAITPQQKNKGVPDEQKITNTQPRANTSAAVTSSKDETMLNKKKLSNGQSAASTSALKSLKKTARRQQQTSNEPPTPPCSMHPEQHPSVVALLEEDELEFEFHHIEDVNSRIKEIVTNIMGEFECTNARCSKLRWPSRTIAVSIRLFPGKRYNATVYNQRCVRCKTLGAARLDESYAERVAYWLKKWSGVYVEPPPRRSSNQGPHQEELCEGCKVGQCPWVRREERFYNSN
jgi:hypothetical protein